MTVSIGRNVTGKEAEAAGLVAKCFDTKDEMMEYVHTKVAQVIAAKSPITIR